MIMFNNLLFIMFMLFIVVISITTLIIRHRAKSFESKIFSKLNEGDLVPYLLVFDYKSPMFKRIDEYLKILTQLI